MNPTFGWYVMGALASLLVAPGAVVYTIIGLIQLRNASGQPGASRAKVTLAVYLGIAALIMILWIAGSASTTSSSTATYP